jgi:hypothetical protein
MFYAQGRDDVNLLDMNQLTRLISLLILAIEALIVVVLRSFHWLL